MDTEREDAYYELLEEMIDSMTQIGGYDRDWIVDIVKRICELFRLTKAETRFYRSEELERLGDGEVISDYDNGKSDHIAMQKKAVSKTDGSLTSLVYMAKGDELTDEEKVKVDLMLRIMINFIGRNRLHNAVELLVEEDEQNEIRERELHIREIFPKAIKDGEFHVFYQPKVDVTWGKLVGAEALCRWFHDGKIVPPLDFIPVLEMSTDICKLDYKMLEMVCMDLRRWIDSGKKVVRVSVNFSRKNLSDEHLLENILKIVDKYEIPHEFIEVELTETTTDVAFRDLRRVVTGLEEAGIATSVDDFGIGYSSLTLLQDIPWKVLKIDRSFLPTDEEKVVSKNHLMFKHVVSMAREIGLECVTAGVETKKQVMILRKNHCHTAQGFFFDKPMPVEEFETRLDKPMYDLSHLSEEWRFRGDETAGKKV